MTLPDAAWMASAACRGHPGLDDFFPPDRTAYEDLGADARAGVDRAQAICAACPVDAECDAFAAVTLAVGVWGGSLRVTPAPEALADRRVCVRCDGPVPSRARFCDQCRPAAKAAARERKRLRARRRRARAA